MHSLNPYPDRTSILRPSAHASERAACGTFSITNHCGLARQTSIAKARVNDAFLLPPACPQPSNPGMAVRQRSDPGPFGLSQAQQRKYLSGRVCEHIARHYDGTSQRRDPRHHMPRPLRYLHVSTQETYPCPAKQLNRPQSEYPTRMPSRIYPLQQKDMNLIGFLRDSTPKWSQTRPGAPIGGELSSKLNFAYNPLDISGIQQGAELPGTGPDDERVLSSGKRTATSCLRITVRSAGSTYLLNAGCYGFAIIVTNNFSKYRSSLITSSSLRLELQSRD